MELKFTPGPWEIFSDDLDIDTPTYILSSVEGRPEDKSELNDGFDLAHAYGPDQMANALLIHASPDLAAALIAILREVTPGPVPPHSADSYLPAHLIEQARAALEKAGVV